MMEERVTCLEVLSDGSLVSCGSDRQLDGGGSQQTLLLLLPPLLLLLLLQWVAKSIKTTIVKPVTLRLVGIYEVHKTPITRVVEKDDDTFITASRGGIMKVWNKTTCECLHTLNVRDSIFYLSRSRDKSTIVVGKCYGGIELRWWASEAINSTVSQLAAFAS